VSANWIIIAFALTVYFANTFAFIAAAITATAFTS
jgi:hypothetical protein